MAGCRGCNERDKDKEMLIVWKSDCFVTMHRQSYLNGYGRLGVSEQKKEISVFGKVVGGEILLELLYDGGECLTLDKTTPFWKQTKILVNIKQGNP